jgi:hypothetical protein
MTTSVLPHAQTLPTEVQLHRVPKHIADQFDDLMHRADQAISLYEIRPIHAQAAQLIGMQLPDSQDIVKCNCGGCYCDRVIDAKTARTYMNGTVEFVQCPACADEHRITSD